MIIRNIGNYPDLVLLVGSSNFGDQILKLRHERFDGSTQIIWSEMNQEGSHRTLNDRFKECMLQTARNLGV